MVKSKKDALRVQFRGKHIQLKIPKLHIWVVEIFYITFTLLALNYKQH